MTESLLLHDEIGTLPERFGGVVQAFPSKVAGFVSSGESRPGDAPMKSVLRRGATTRAGRMELKSDETQLPSSPGAGPSTGPFIARQEPAAAVRVNPSALKRTKAVTYLEAMSNECAVKSKPNQNRSGWQPTLRSPAKAFTGWTQGGW